MLEPVAVLESFFGVVAGRISMIIVNEVLHLNISC